MEHYQNQKEKMSCPTQAPHNIHIVGPDFLCYGNYPPARRRSIAAQPAWVPDICTRKAFDFRAMVF